jgi:hypothetical protein
MACGRQQEGESTAFHFLNIGRYEIKKIMIITSASKSRINKDLSTAQKPLKK